MKNQDYSVSKSRDDGSIAISTKTILRFSQVKSVIALLDVEWEALNSHIDRLSKETPWKQNCAWACVGVAGSAIVALIPNMFLNTIPDSTTNIAGNAMKDVFENAYKTYRLSNSILILVLLIALGFACVLFYKSFNEKKSNAITSEILQEEIKAINKRLTEEKPVTTTSDSGLTEPHPVVMTGEQSNESNITTS